MHILFLLREILYTIAAMTWVIFWPLMLGFIISGIIMAFVPRQRLVKLLGKSGVKEILLSTFFGAISSSCSYAAASMSRSLFQKGADIICALAFMLASTNLVLELSLVLWVMLGWQMVLAEVIGGIILVFIMAFLMKTIGPLKDFEKKRVELTDHEVQSDDKTFSPRTKAGWIKASQEFVMEVQMIWKDIALGLVISAMIMVLVPQEFWQKLFLTETSNSVLKLVENAFVGPLVSALSFVCSVGNIPLARALYQGGIGFGGTVSFIFADLLIIPLIFIYRKYYGWKLALSITGIFYFSMVIAGITVELLFKSLHLIPPHPTGTIMTNMDFKLNYTFWLNGLFLLVSGILLWLARSEGSAESHCCEH